MGHIFYGKTIGLPEDLMRGKGCCLPWVNTGRVNSNSENVSLVHQKGNGLLRETWKMKGGGIMGCATAEVARSVRPILAPAGQEKNNRILRNGPMLLFPLRDVFYLKHIIWI